MNEGQALTLGSFLRQERERRNIALDSIANETRISRQHLEALERDDLHLLPAPVFVRGFLRTYANYLGIDPKEVLALYEDQTDFSKISSPKKSSEPPKKIRPLMKFTLILFILALATGIFFLAFSPKTTVPPPVPPAPTPQAIPLQTPLDKKPPMEAPSPPQKSLLKTPKVLSPPSAPTPGLTEAAPKKERRHVLKINATEVTWLRIQSDDQEDVEATLQPQETQTWTARRQFKITIGNAGGVEIFFNGVSQGRLGDSGKVVHLLLPQDIKKKVDREQKKETTTSPSLPE